MQSGDFVDGVMIGRSDRNLDLPVVHASYARGPIRGGERQMLLLVEELARHGIPQVVVCRRGDGTHEYASSLQGVKTVAAVHHVIDGFRPIPARLYHAHEARAAYWAAMSSLLTRTPFLITKRTPNPLSKNRLTRWVYNRASALVGISGAVCEVVRERIGRDPSLIYSAHRNLTADPEKVRRIKSEIGGKPVIGQVGALVDKHKGQSHSIEALKRIRSAYPHATLVLMGTGADEETLRKQAEPIGGVVFAGHRQDIADWIAACDLLLHPANEEGLGSTLLDAMHLEVPIVASRIDGIPEIAQDGISALLIEPGDTAGLADAALRVLADDALRARLIAGGREVAIRLGPEMMAKAYLDLYAEIAGGIQPKRLST